MNNAWVLLLAVASLGLLAFGLLVGAWTRRRLGIAASLLLVVSVLAWGAALVAIASGYRDADGFVDCGDFCTGTHRLAAVGFVAPPLLVALAAAGMLVALLERLRRKRRSV